MLAEHAALTRGLLEKYLEEQVHRPYLGPLVSDYPHRSSDLVAPAICLLAVRAAGGRIADALETATALELVHHALQVHHDIADDRQWRDDRPSLQRLFGLPLAINAGDTLTLLSLRPLLDSRRRLGPSLSLLVMKEIEKLIRFATRGWAQELFWRRDATVDLTEEDYLAMVLERTSWPMAIGPLRIGSSIAHHGTLPEEAFVRFGFFWSAALQIRREVAELVDTEPNNSRQEGCLVRRTLPLTILLRRCSPAERSRLAGLLAHADVESQNESSSWMRHLMNRYDCLDSSLVKAQSLAGAALHEAGRLPTARIGEKGRELLTNLVFWAAPDTQG